MILATTGLYFIDNVTAEYEYVDQLATVVLGEHSDNSGHRAICPCVPFPCGSALLAAAIHEPQDQEW